MFPLLTLYTIGYLGMMVAEFVLRGFFNSNFVLAPGFMPVYIALTAAYAADKEIRRLTGIPEPPRKGVFFVYASFLFFLAAFIIRSFRPEFAMSDELGKVVLQVRGSFFGSRTSKYFCESRLKQEVPEIAGQRELLIMEMLKTRGRIKKSDVAGQFRLSDTSTRRVLSEMVAKGLIRRVGERKSTY